MKYLEKLKPTLDKASEKYVNATVIRVGISSIPYIGGSLDILFSAKGNELIQERIQSFLEYLDKEMQKIKEDKIDKDYIQSESWFDLVYISFDEVRKTRLKEKHKLFAKILANSTVIYKSKTNVEQYQKLVSYFSVVDFIVLTELYNKINIVMGSDYKAIIEFWGNLKIDNLSKEELDISISRLFSQGLLRERYGAILDYDGGHYLITPLMINFMKFMAEDEEDLK